MKRTGVAAVILATVSLSGAAAGSASAAGPCGSTGAFANAGSVDSCTYSTAGEGTFSVPSGTTDVRVVATGAGGGRGGGYGGPALGAGFGGDGAIVTVPSLTVGAGATLNVEVGSVGGDASSCTPGTAGGSGGGAGGAGACATGGGGGGGGESDVRLTPLATSTLTGDPATDPRLVVAGGGGGGGGDVNSSGTVGGSAGAQQAGAGDAGSTDCDTSSSQPGGAGGIGAGNGHAGSADDPQNCGLTPVLGSDGGPGTGGSGGTGGAEAGGGGGGAGFAGGGGGVSTGAEDGEGTGGGAGSSYGPAGTTYATASSTSVAPKVVISWTASAPTVTIQTPAANASYPEDASAASSFSCGQTGGSVTTCVDQSGQAAGSPIDTHTAGSHTLSVTATAADGQTTTRSVTYTVEPATTTTTTTTTTPTTPVSPPPAVAPLPLPVAVASARAGAAGLVYRLSAARSSAAGSTITGYRWTLDGRVIGNGPILDHAFPHSGHYVITLTVTDATGAATTIQVPLVAHVRRVTTRLTVHFALDHAGLTRSDRRAVAALRAAYAHASRVRIVGFCAGREVGRDAAILRLSRERAQAVLALLDAHRNRTSGRVTLVGAGARALVATNRTAAGRARNRRATLVITYPKPIG